MISPFKGRFRVTSPRGTRTLGGKEEYHKGLDLVGTDDTTVYAVANGKVTILYEKNGFGNYIRQQLSDGKRIYYGHLKSIFAENGKDVVRGEPLGIMGATGRVTGPHLHLEIRPAGITSDSLDIAQFCGIPNAVGEYAEKESRRLSYDDTVDALISCGIVTEENMVSWELMLSGKAELNREYVRTLFDRCCKKIKELERNDEII